MADSAGGTRPILKGGTGIATGTTGSARTAPSTIGTGSGDTYRTGHSSEPVTTSAASLSTALTIDSWIVGVEAGNGAVDKIKALPGGGLHGYQASIGYVFNPGLELSTGWQRLTYNRSSGAFYNGGPRIAMDAAFLHLNLHTTP